MVISERFPDIESNREQSINTRRKSTQILEYIPSAKRSKTANQKQDS
jgi:hypothetical protein